MQFIIPGDPIPLKRARAYTRNGQIHHYNCQRSEMQALKNAIKAQLPNKYKCGTQPLHLIVSFHIAFPASYTKKKRELLRGTHHTLKPDLSNLIKFYEDALNCVLWTDDQQIARISSRKIWDDEAKTVLKIQPLDKQNDGNLT